MAARGYLGKISAIVSVNTDDARSRLSASAKDFQRYARSVQGTIGSATTSAGRAFDAIFTPLQKLQRALAATQSGNLGKTLGLGISQEEVTRVQQLVSAAEQLARPLGNSAKQFAGLSAAIAGEFQPALVRAQAQVELARVAIDKYGSISEKAFAGVEARVQTTTQAIARLVEVQNLVDGGRTGQELSFRAPRVQDELSRSAQLSQQAATLPASLREDPSIRTRIEELARLRQEIARYQASVERRQALGLDTREAQSQLDGVIRRSSDIRESLEATIRVDVDARAAQSEIDRLKASLATIRDNVTFTVTGEVQNFDQARQELGRLTGAVEQFDVAQRAAFGANLQRLGELVETGDVQELEQVRRLLAEIGDTISVTVNVDAAIQRIRSINQVWDEAVRGVPTTLAQVDSQFQALASRISNLNIDDRLDLDPLIRDFRDSAAAGSPLIAQYERLLALQQKLDDIDSRGNPTGPSGPVLPPGFGGASDAGLGRALDDPQRQIEALRGGITSLKGQIDSLPAGLRARFIPAVNRAEEEFRRLAASPAATTAEIERAARAVDRLSQRANRTAQSLRLPSFRQFTRELGSRQAIGELQALQQILSRIGAQAGGPAAQAYELYRQRLQRAIRTGTEGLPQVRRELELLQQSAARAAAATGRISYGAALREIRRGGDVARGGFDNLSLAVQQAAFAIDDFFSSTGDFTQKIRAVQNNVTQLAFILGGTRGLFIGLGVAITAQAVVGLINWINNGRTAEDSTKALNDALARQKSLVEALAESFRSLADALTSGTLSGQAEDAKKFSDELKKAADARKELNQERIFQNDPGIRREQSEQARIQREMDKASTVEEQISLQQQMEESRRREKNRRAVALLPAPDDIEVEGAIRRRAPNPFRGDVPDLPSGGDFDSLMARRDALEAPLNRLREIVNEGGLSADIAAESYDQLNSLAARLDAAIGNALSEVETGLLESARAPSEAIRGAQEDLAAAIREGIPGARELGLLVDEVGAQFNAAVQAVEDAAKIENERERNDALAAAGEQLRAATARRGEVEAAGGSVRSQAIQNPESLFSALISRIESGLSGLGVGENGIRARFRSLQAERATVVRQLEADPTNKALIDAEQGLIRAIASLEGEVASLDETFNGFEAREARRLQGNADRGRELLLSPEQKAAEELQQGLNDIFARFGEIAEATTGVIDQPALRQAQEQFAARFSEQQLRQNEGIQRDRQFDDELRRRRAPEGDATRGIDLIETSAQRAARETEQGVADIVAGFDEQLRSIVDANDGLPGASVVAEADALRAQRDDALQRFANDQRRASAPAIFALADSVENALLQGPSRAALNVSDISTQDGARELNRLLRGEDSARDQNLIELQKQSQSLDLVNQKLAALGNRVGVAL
jgi:HAMP domain-containing protein